MVDRWLWQTARRSFRVLSWVAATSALGAATTARAVRSCARLGVALAETRRCPRGHDVPLYGVYECSTCRAPHEGWVFSECRVCGLSAGWTPCIECGLPVVNPLRGA